MVALDKARGALRSGGGALFEGVRPPPTGASRKERPLITATLVDVDSGLGFLLCLTACHGAIPGGNDDSDLALALPGRAAQLVGWMGIASVITAKDAPQGMVLRGGFHYIRDSAPPASKCLWHCRNGRNGRAEGAGASAMDRPAQLEEKNLRWYSGSLKGDSDTPATTCAHN